MHSMKLFDKHSIFSMKLQHKRKNRKHHSLPVLPSEQQLSHDVSQGEIHKLRKEVAELNSMVREMLDNQATFKR